jgi:GST-like protein
MAQEWAPPNKIEELFAKTAGNQFSSMNSNKSGARTEFTLPVGPSSLQLYSLATPNGMKVSIMLEELGVDYDAYTVQIGSSDQFTSGFVGVNPNSKIPALVDLDGPGGKPLNLFESGNIVLYLAEKYKKFIPTDLAQRYQVLNWVFWQMAGQGPMAGNFGHFMVYAPPDKCEARDYGCARYGMETQRLLHVLETALQGKTYLVGEEYTIADIMCYPWVGALRVGYKHKNGIAANDFLSVDENYPNVIAWCERIKSRPAVARGVQVCPFSDKEKDNPKPWLKENKL